MTTPRQTRLIAVRMMEDQGPDSLDANVRQLVSDFNLQGLRHRDSKRAGMKGWPDWVILGWYGVLCRELKSEHGVVSVDQRRVGSMLTRAGYDWQVWRPTQLLDGTIARQLAAIARKT